jgi:hypothetical protein
VRSTVSSVVIALILLSSTPATASADDVVPSADSPCPPDSVGALTWPPNAKLPLQCVGGPTGGRWQALTVPGPPADVWLSVGPQMTLHGEARRNPSARSGAWTATPRTADTRCRAEQVTVAGPGVLNLPETAEGQPGQSLDFRVAPRMADLLLSGDCLWRRTSD